MNTETETLQNRAKRLVEQEVHLCLSMLVSPLAQAYGEAKGDLGELAEQAFELCCGVPDYEEAAIQAGWQLDASTDKWWNPKDDDGSRYVNGEHAFTRICEDHNLDPYEREIFEHWAVSKWLGEQLAAKGERVDFDFASLVVWGRTTTGQAIYCDRVIEEITEELHNQ